MQAVRGADFSVATGQLHALLGENGAGKTTLMRIAAGLVSPDRGGLSVNGTPIRIRNPRDARRAGIGMVHQQFATVPAFTVLENVALGMEGPLRWGELTATVRRLNEDLGFALDPSAPADILPFAALQRLELLKLLAGKASILILDEPTGSLSPAEAGDLLGLVRRLVDGGSSAVLITHKLNESIRFADRVTVLRHGRVVLSGETAGRSTSELAAAMLGEALIPGEHFPAPTPGAVLASAEGVTVSPLDGKGPGIREASFQLRGGETVGIAAVEGNGERELLRAVAGLVPHASGRLLVAEPVSLVPEDRAVEGVIADFTLAENMTLGLGGRAAWISHGLIDRARARSETSRLVRQHEIAALGPDTLAGTLSGGNQQKLILARALALRPRVLVAENPGRGLDIRAAQVSFGRLRTAAAEGAAVLIHSSDLDELLEWCDRIIVVANGRAHNPPPGSSRETIGRLMLGVAG